MNEQYYEVVIEGHFDLMKGFIMGFLAGRGIEGGVFLDQECHIEGECSTGPPHAADRRPRQCQHHDRRIGTP